MKYATEHIAVNFQEGPIGEAGRNGCQLVDLVALCLEELNRVDREMPCRENALARTKLEEAAHWLDHRTRDRERRGVEGSRRP